MKSKKYIGLIMAMAMLMAGCANDDEYVAQDGPVNVELAYAFTSPVTNQPTRQAAEVVSDATNPRPPQYIRMIPIYNSEPKQSAIVWEDPVSKTNPKSQFFRSRYCVLSSNINGFIVYGSLDKIPGGTNPKMYNGSLIETFPASITTVDDVQEGIGFNLEAIYKSTDYASTNGIPAGAQALADCLTAIATTEGFNTSADATIKGFFDKFINNGSHLPGSAASVRKWIETFRDLIDGNADPILSAVYAEAGTQLSAIASLTYPRDISLPDGAAVLRWIKVGENNETVNKFVPQINTTTIDNINSIARFAYPAPLYYYIASDIKTSEDKVDFEDIYSQVETDETKTAWDKVLANEKFNKTSVSANTKAVALVRPIEYAVAQLKVKIKAYTATLKDAENTDVDVSGNKFLLTGIIVCDQRPVGYRFLPKTVEEGEISDTDVLFIYDSQVKSECYLNPQGEDVWAEGCNTLVLQSLKDEDVNIILEFQNDSGSPFTCLDGIVYPGTRFYMIGRVEASLYNTETAQEANRHQVFTKDFITTVNMTVSSLAKAYNVPPNLLSPNLEIGVETTPQWEGATPTVIRLE